MNRSRKMPPAVQLRQNMIVVLRAVLEQGQSLDRALQAQTEAVSTADRSMLSEVCFGVLRWHRLLEAILGRALRKPLRGRDHDLHLLLLVAAYQMLFMRVPDYAAVDSAVATARVIGRAWAGGLVNGVLRNLGRQREAWLDEARREPAVRWSVPDWILRHWQTDWGVEAPAVAEASCERAPMWLRVDLDRTSREAVLAELDKAGIAASAPAAPASALRLAEPIAVAAIPGFNEGLVSVQDAAAQFAAPVLAPAAGQRVLDACAAPGGKTLHLIEVSPDSGTVIALDQDASRLQRVGENLRRCGRDAQICCGDAAAPESWWDGQCFDRILLDAPCSGSGVIRRHPDIKHLRRPQDIDELAALQARMLAALWPLLARGGMLLYATCSVFKRENEAQLTAFLSRHDDASALPLALPVGRASGPGWQILSGEAGMDGFFYGLLAKREARA